VPDDLPSFGLTAAQWPRDRALYKAPLLLVKVTAVSDRDLVFAEAFFGAPFPASHREAAHILAGVLGSALAAWFFLMTAGEFGLYKRRLFRQDVALLPTPDLNLIAGSDAVRKIYALEQQFRSRAVTAEDWVALDEAVFDLYGLDADDRIVVRDGLLKAGWAEASEDVSAYARTFSAVLDRWLSARRQRSNTLCSTATRGARRVLSHTPFWLRPVQTYLPLEAIEVQPHLPQKTRPVKTNSPFRLAWKGLS
jgi:hypothetical protein